MKAVVCNERGAAQMLLVCDHASNHVPEEFAGLNLSDATLQGHAAWDIGAFDLARRLALTLDAPLVAAPASRLLVDPNRDVDAPDLIPEVAEHTPVLGNICLGAAARAARVANFHDPYHAAIEATLRMRADIIALVSIHSFTPVLFGERRPWHVGVLHGQDRRVADVLLSALARDAALVTGRNVPYAPSDGVFYTMDRHANGRATAMIEVRNDLLRDEAGQCRMAHRLAEATREALSEICTHCDASPPSAEEMCADRGHPPWKAC